MSRVFDVDGKQMVFSFQAFNTIFNNYHSSKHLKVKSLIEQMRDKLGVSYDTVQNWRKKKNGPADLEMVKSIASALEIKDYTILLTEKDGGNKMAQLTDRQKTAAKKIYDKCIWFLNEFNHTDGFNDFWLEFKDAGHKDPEGKSYDKVSAMMDEIFLVYNQEYFDLKGHPIYDDFWEYLSDDLYETFDGKLSYAYRFEAIPNGQPTVSEDYDKAMITLNGIIDKYL